MIGRDLLEISDRLASAQKRLDGLWQNLQENTVTKPVAAAVIYEVLSMDLASAAEKVEYLRARL